MLENPLVETFLWMKWRRVKWYFFLNFAFHCLFTLCITTLTFIVNKMETKNGAKNVLEAEAVNNGFFWCFYDITLLLLIIVSIREAFQVN